MRARRIVTGLALAAALTVLAPVASADEALTVVNIDAGAYPDVRMVVAVPGSLGDPAEPAATVTVSEAGARRPATLEALPAEGLDVALVIDTSGSMVGAPLAAAKAAAQAFLGQLPASVPVSVIGFGASPSVVSPRSTNRTAQVAAIRALSAGGQTALYDALRAALIQFQLPGAGARQMAVLLTDGGDTASTASLDITADALAKAKVPLFAVELRTSESSPAALARLTSASGGRVVPAADPAALAGAFDDVAAQLVRQYALTYRSAGHGGTDVDVAVEARGVRATARARVDLPAAAATTVAAAPPAAATPAGVGDWALLVGAGLFGLALLVPLLLYATNRTPRARGVTASRRGIDLSRMTDKAEWVSDTLLRRRGGIAAVSSVLELAGLDLRPGELFAGIAAGFLLLFTLGWFLFNPLVGLVLAVMVPVGARVVVHILAAQRRSKFSAQLPDTLQILAGSLRAGHGLSQGIETVAREAESPTSEEFRRLTIETRLGRDFVESLGALAQRVDSEDFGWVVQAVTIQREVGGDLAAILDTVAATVRDRTRIKLQVSSLSAEGRLSAVVLMVLPFGLGAMMAVTNRNYMDPLFTTATGYKLLAVAAALLTVGGLWLKKIVKPTF
ncbi:MAG TPA: type II secretion system F family protein [Acidimicrobiales bacterium]|nr:type II secretion system F family protein [Acidimicrobiales bacterium]